MGTGYCPLPPGRETRRRICRSLPGVGHVAELGRQVCRGDRAVAALRAGAARRRCWALSTGDGLRPHRQQGSGGARIRTAAQGGSQGAGQLALIWAASRGLHAGVFCNRSGWQASVHICRALRPDPELSRPEDLKKFLRLPAAFIGGTSLASHLRCTCPKLRELVARFWITTMMAGWTFTWSTAVNAISSIRARRCATHSTATIATAP